MRLAEKLDWKGLSCISERLSINTDEQKTGGKKKAEDL
jgi:hypothetical protein